MKVEIKNVNFSSRSYMKNIDNSTKHVINESITIAPE